MARAVLIREPGGVEVLDLGTHEVRAPGAGEVLVDVAAAGLNRADLLQRMGVYPAPAGAPSNVAGIEFAGVVASIGHGVASVAPGDRVMGIVGGGAMATTLTVHERELIPVPAGMPIEEAAAVPEAFLTAYDALFLQAGLRIGQVALVHAAASGVGTAALQLVRAAGATAIGTLRSQDKIERARAFGDVLVVRDARFADEVLSRAPGGAHVVLDLVGGRYLPESLRALAQLGIIVLVGLLDGARTELDLAQLLKKRAIVRGTVLRSRPLEERAALARAFTRDVVPLLSSGAVRPVIDVVLPMTEVREAHRRMADNASFGKIVLRW